MPSTKCALVAIHGSSKSRLSSANALDAGATTVSVSLFTATVAHMTESSSEQKDIAATTRWSLRIVPTALCSPFFAFGSEDEEAGASISAAREDGAASRHC